MRKVTGVGAVIIAVVSYAWTGGAASGQQPDVSEPGSIVRAEGSDAWFVELASAPTAEGTTLQQVRNEKAAFRRAAAAAGVKFEERYAYDGVFNGLAIRTASTRSELARIAGVKAVYPVVAVALPEPEAGESPELFSALGLTGADAAQNELGLTGQGVRVAVMDTGIDYHHPALGGCFGRGCRVEVGFDFVGDAFNASDAAATIPVNPVPVPDPNPDDCQGHGTHVAGIVGAADAGTGLTGVAPGVTFGAYRVFGCDGNTTSDIMLAAMDRILADGADVLNMSIGAAFQWPQYPTARGADRLVRKGIVVVASAGNSGANGLYSLSAPSVGDKVISVASFDNVESRARVFTISDDDRPISFNQATGAPAAPSAGDALMARTGTPTSTADACDPLAAGSLAGRVALIRRGTCGFFVKATNAQNAGAIAVVIYNNVAGRQSITVAGTPAVTIPVVSISDVDGVLINNRIAAGPVTLTWTSDVSVTPFVSGNTISGFSSYGASPDLSLKPEIGAPGGQIWSTYPLEKGGFFNNSGTSMASPHVAGGVALMLEARPNTAPAEVRTILQNTALPKNWWGNPALGFLDNVHRQGAGMLQIDDAIRATTRVEPARLALGESEGGAATRQLTIKNHAAAAVTYQLSHVAGLATGPNTFAPAFFNSPATVTFGAASVTVPAGGSATVGVTIAPNAALAERSLYGGYIVLTPVGGGQVYRVPFSGFKGDYQSIRALEPTRCGFPLLARIGGSTACPGTPALSLTGFTSQPAGASYTLVGDDVPVILVHLDHQVRRLRFEVTEVGTGTSWHRAIEDEYVGRNSGVTSFFAVPWDGRTAAGRKIYVVPNGQYQITVTVVKALADESNPAHVEAWTSPVITIARPPATTP
jgi:minor extracellular serine protease Vpr